MRRKAIQLFLIFAGVVLVVVAGILLSVGARSGQRASGARLDRIKASPQWHADKQRFSNRMGQYQASFFEMGRQYFFGGSKDRLPKADIQTIKVDPALFKKPPRSGLRITWAGHSSFIIELDELKVLIDPVWSDRASPFTWAGPKRFYAPPLALNELPAIDVVLISHDHYDHLDYETVLHLRDRPLKWLVPLGVGAHLEYWGVDAAKIEELDWWENRTFNGVKLTATPARHFSGRSAMFLDQNATLWAGWALNGTTRSVFYSGDTALHPGFKEIGERLGPFDLTLMETGAYNSLWPDVHLGPEQAALAHQLVRGKVMMPSHWGLFDLALHGWTEPAERVIKAAEALNVSLSIIKPGGTFDIADAPTIDKFWPETPWQVVNQAPAWSTEVETLQAPLRAQALSSPETEP